MMFEAISLIENYHPRNSLRWQLGRVFTLYVGNLYSFLIAVIDQISFTVSYRGAFLTYFLFSVQHAQLYTTISAHLPDVILQKLLLEDVSVVFNPNRFLKAE